MSIIGHTVRVGFIPLLDAAPVIVARELGFAADEGLDLQLSRETSWATLRDRLAVAHLDAAHALAPLPIAANLGLGPLPGSLLVPMALGFGANTVTVSRTLWADLADHGAAGDLDAADVLRALVEVARIRKHRDSRPLVLGIVHPHSAHHYQLAYWLAVGKLIPGRDVELVVLPPSLMPAALAGGQIDGFCAGEPWGTLAVLQGSGAIATTNAHIWQSSPEKVLAVRRAWSDDNEERVTALTRAVHRAAMWCDEPGNAADLASILSRAEWIGQAPEVLMPSLTRRLPAPCGREAAVEGFLTFAAGAATFPWRSHALWFFSQMVRWRQSRLTPERLALAQSTYRPDLFRRAVAGIGLPVPSANSKVEGALVSAIAAGSPDGRLVLGPDTFFDGRQFDPADLDSYVSAQQAADVSV